MAALVTQHSSNRSYGAWTFCVEVAKARTSTFDDFACKGTGNSLFAGEGISSIALRKSHKPRIRASTILATLYEAWSRKSLRGNGRFCLGPTAY
jgi:hypothetical protein